MKLLLEDAKKNKAGAIILAAILLITTLEWHFAEWYEAFTVYGTLITFVFLAAIALIYKKIPEYFKDKEMITCVVVSVVALINLFLVHSGFGAILIVVDFALVLYFADKLTFSKLQTRNFLVYTAFFFFYWTIDVKGYFKGYNTNYGGLILLSGFACLQVIMTAFYQKIFVKNENSADGKHDINHEDADSIKRATINKVIYVILAIAFLIIAFKIISWYRSRTALIGLLVLLLIMIIPEKIITNKFVFTFINLCGTIGAILLTLLYIGLGNIVGEGGIQLFYKNLISGRNDIWLELWTEYLKMPLTGIGSSYVVKVDFMNGMLEAHSGMLDILIIHGIIVFIPICVLFVIKLNKLREHIIGSRVKKTVYAAIICTLFAGMFENFYIVQPFSLILLSYFCIARSDSIN